MIRSKEKIYRPLGTYQSLSIFVTGVPKGEGKDSRTEKIYILVDWECPNLVNGMNLESRGSTSHRGDKIKENQAPHITIKLLQSSKDKPWNPQGRKMKHHRDSSLCLFWQTSGQKLWRPEDRGRSETTDKESRPRLLQTQKYPQKWRWDGDLPRGGKTKSIYHQQTCSMYNKC